MDMVVDPVTELELDLSNYSNSTTTTTATTPNTSTTTTPLLDDHWWSNWNDWSPIDGLLVIDWDSLSSNHDNFHGLIESMMDNDDNNNEPQHDPEARVLSTTATMAVVEEEEEMTGGIGDFKGLRLVHLLMAAAEALTGVNKSHELARVILVRLKDLASPTDGTNMERLAAHFTHALQGLLEGAAGKYMGSHHDLHQTDVLAAFQLLQDMSPYVKFGHFTANQAILEAVAHDKRVHIVDYDIMEGIQWASLMQALVSRKDGPPAPHLRITAISRGGASRRSIGTVQETGRRLIAFAASIGQSLTFHQCRLDSNETFRPSNLKLVRGEALVFNCMLYLCHFNYCASDSIASFLSGAKTLNPRLVTLVEEEVGPVGDGGFAGRFMDSLHHYSAVYDSLEAGFPMQSRARELVERVFLGPQISGSLARIYRESGEEESCSWGEWLGAVGFHPVNVSFANHCQAKLLLGLFNDGYKVEELANNRLVLGWKTRRLLSASVWTTSDSNL